MAGLSLRGGCGATVAPGGGASGCDWMAPAPGRLEGGRLIGAGSGCAGGASLRGAGGALGTLAGGRGGSSRNIRSNCASAGVATSAVAASALTSEQTMRVRRAIEPGCFAPGLADIGPARAVPG